MTTQLQFKLLFCRARREVEGHRDGGRRSSHGENVNFSGHVAEKELVAKERFLSQVKPHYKE